MSVETDNPLNEVEDDVSESGQEEVDAEDAVYVKLGLRKEFTEGDVDAFIKNWCLNAHNSTWLDTTIIIAILINTVILSHQNPATMLDEDILHAYYLIDVVLTLTFSWEMFVRIIAIGFYNKNWNSNPKFSEGPQKYLNDSWNKLDFAVVISSWLNVLVEATGMKLPIELSTLRALRVLRVLRSLRMFSGIKTILAVVAQAMPYSVNVLAFLGFLFIVCGIIGIQMFRGHTLSRCEYGSFDLQAELATDKYPFVQLDAAINTSWTTVLGTSSPSPKPLIGDDQYNATAVLYQNKDSDGAFEMDSDYLPGDAIDLPSFASGTTAPGYTYCQSTDPADTAKCEVDDRETAAGAGYEYPIGIGMWYTYCTVDEDCPLFNKRDQYNRTQVCVPSLNPGKTFHGYDDVLQGWIALFINMACLYWWETAHRFSDYGATSPNDLGAEIAWSYGLINVTFLTYISVNMFVAVITTVFADVRSAENPEGGMKGKDDKPNKKAYRDKWTPPFYYVKALGGPSGPYEEKKKKGEQEADREGLINGSGFNNFIMFFIIFNTAILAMDHHNSLECISNTVHFGDNGTQANAVWDPEDGGHYKEMCQSETFIMIETSLNYLFNFVFTMELILKILGMGFKAYIRVPFNQLDFFIVTTSILDMVGEALQQPGEDSSGLGSLKMFRILRLFRVLRVARFLYKNKNLKRVLQTVFGSGEALGNLGLFIFFSIMLFGIMGMHMFGGNYHPMNERLQDATGFGYCDLCANEDGCCISGETLEECPKSLIEFEAPIRCFGDNSGTLWGRLVGDGEIRVTHAENNIVYGYDVEGLIAKGLIPRRNFEDFPRAFLLAFQVMTGDDWVNQMHDHLQVFNGWAPAFLFFLNFAFCNFILLSLFIAVILENFEVAEAEKMKLQKDQHKTKLEVWEEDRKRPKITFVHRCTWCCGGAGKGDGLVAADIAEDVVDEKKSWSSASLNIHPLNGKILAVNDSIGPLLQKALDVGVEKDDLRAPQFEKDENGEFVFDEDPLTGVKKKIVTVDKDDYDWTPTTEDIIALAKAAGADEDELNGVEGLSSDAKYYNDDKSCFTFGPEDPIRLMCKKAANNYWFSDVVVLGAILLGTVLLAWEGPPGSLDPSLVETFDVLQTILYFIFLFEFIFKVIGYGFFFTPDAYIKDPWNKLDFTVIIGSTITILGGNAGPIRLLRCLRPLRIVARNEGMRVIITAVVNSLAVNVGVLALAGMGILMFGILGVALFGGKFYSCNCSHSFPLGVMPDAYTVDYNGVATYAADMPFGDWQSQVNDIISPSALQQSDIFRGRSPCGDGVSEGFYVEDACVTTEVVSLPGFETTVEAVDTNSYCTLVAATGSGVFDSLFDYKPGSCAVKDNAPAGTTCMYKYGEHNGVPGQAKCAQPAELGLAYPIGNETTKFELQQVMDKRQCVGKPIGMGFEGYYPENVFGVDPSFPNAISKCYWDNRPYNFDSTGNAMMALFTASTLAGWTDIMEIAVDMRGIDMQPMPFATMPAVLYFLFYVLVMAFFVTNLFIGVLIDFIGHSDGSALLTEDQQKLQDMDKFQKLHRPQLEEEAPPNCLRRWFYGLVESMFWNQVSNGVIVFNVVVMLCEHETQSHEWYLMLEYLNYACLWFFTVEMLFKLIAYFPKKYWEDPWSKFDAIVIIFSWAAIFFNLGSVQAIRAMRAFRIVLVLKSAKGIRSLFQTLMLSIPPAVNISVLLFLLYALYAILGMQLFGNAPLQDLECMVPNEAAHAADWKGGVAPWSLSPEGCTYECQWNVGNETVPAGFQPEGCQQCDLHFCDVGTPRGINYKYWYGIKDGKSQYTDGKPSDAAAELAVLFDSQSRAFAGISGGGPGHMMMGLNRQYTRHASFRSFPSALKLLFQCAAGQDWKFVMYAVGGEPGNPGGGGQPGIAFMYFFTFFFFSNYILLNLFIAVILDNFAASMREQELDISEQDFEAFKYLFRSKTTDEQPELLKFIDVWPLLAEVGDTDGHDDSGNIKENPFSPASIEEWEMEHATAWKLSLPSAGTTELQWLEVKDFVQRLYDEGHSPINRLGQPGYDEDRGLDENGRRQELGSFQEYWDTLIGCPGLFKSEPAEVDGVVEPGQIIAKESAAFEDWDAYIHYAQTAELRPDEVNSDDQVKTIGVEDIRAAMQSLRFRDNFKSILNEFRFHGIIFKNDTSTLKYDQVLRAFVQNRMGHEALTLEEQLSRNPDALDEEDEDEEEEPIAKVEENPASVADDEDDDE